jgi:hypothetical protein
MPANETDRTSPGVGRPLERHQNRLDAAIDETWAKTNMRRQHTGISGGYVGPALELVNR